MLKISATLLNSWGYMWQCDENYQEQAYSNFLDYINRVKTPPTDAMQRGIDFEALACTGNVPIISNIIKGGQFQYYGEKTLIVDEQKYKLVGYLDCLKAGVIYDIKRNTRYEFGKYAESYQHHCYFVLVPEAYKFVYLVGAGYTSAPYDEKVEIHTNEEYLNDGKSLELITTTIRDFVAWLKAQGLYEIYEKNFMIKEDI